MKNEDQNQIGNVAKTKLEHALHPLHSFSSNHYKKWDKKTQ